MAPMCATETIRKAHTHTHTPQLAFGMKNIDNNNNK